MKNKKILTLGLTALMTFGLVGCSQNATTDSSYVLTQTMSFVPGATEADMSEYTNLTSNDNFESITSDMLVGLIGDKDANAIIYIGYPGCHNCQNSVKGLQEAAEEAFQTVYYLDCTKEFTSDEAYYKVVNAVKDLLNPETDDEGNVQYLPEYEKDIDGSYKVDENGSYIKVTDEDGNVVYSDEVQYDIYTPLIFQIKNGKINTSNFILGYLEDNDYSSIMDLGGTKEYYGSDGSLTGETEEVDSYFEEQIKMFNEHN